MQLEEPFKTLELFLQKNYLQSSPSFIVSVFNITKRVHPALLHMPCQIALADDWQLLTLCNLRPLRTATDLIHIFLTSLNELALGLIRSHGFREQTHVCAGHEFSCSCSSGLGNALDFSIGRSVEIYI